LMVVMLAHQAVRSQERSLVCPTTNIQACCSLKCPYLLPVANSKLDTHQDCNLPLSLLLLQFL
jgi:hypothetical protein